MAPLFLLIFIDAMSVSLVIPLLGPVMLDNDTDVFMTTDSYAARSLAYGALLGVYSLLMLFFAPLLGRLSDQVGRKRVLMICASGVFLGNFLIAVSIHVASLAVLIVGRLIAGVTAASQATAQAALVDLSRPEKKDFNLSMSLFASSLGFVAGPGVAGFFSNKSVVPWFDFATPLFVAAGMAALCWAMLLFLFSDPVPPAERFDISSLRFSEGIACFRGAFEDGLVFRLLMVFLMMQVAWGAYFLFGSVYLMRVAGFSTGQVSFFMSMLGAGFCLAYAVVQPLLLKRFAVKPLTAAGLGLTALFILCSALLYGPYDEDILAVLCGTAVSVAYAGIVMVFSDVAGKARQGWILGMVGSTAALAWFIASMVAGVLNDFYPMQPMLFAAALMAASAVAMARFRETRATR